MTEYLRWRVRLALERYATRVNDSYHRHQANVTLSDGTSRFDRFVDRLSPFDRLTGYRRVFVRRLLYHLRYPRWYLVRALHELARRALVDYTPRPGRYEGETSPRQTAWFDENSEWATASTGDIDWIAAYDLFLITPPWSRQLESWIVSHDDRGFVSAQQFDNPVEAQRVFARIEHDYERQLESWIVSQEDA